MQTTHARSTNGAPKPPVSEQDKILLADPLKILADMPPTWTNFGREGVPFDRGVAVLEEAHRKDGGDITDMELNLKDASFGTLDHEHLLIAHTATGDSFKIRRTAWGGLMDKMNLGQGATDILLNRLPPELQAANLNVMLKRMTAPKIPAVLRLRHGEVVAIVSERYEPLDTPELIQIARESLLKHGLYHQAMVKAVAAGGRDVIRVTFPSKDRDVSEHQVGDIVSQGLDFRNGSWGGSAISLMTNTVRLICLNGMTRDEKGDTAFHFRHVAGKKQIADKVRESLPKVLASGDGMVERLHQALAVQVIGLGSLFGFFPKDTLQVNEKERIADALQKQLDIKVLGPKERFSLFDGVNAFTQAAQLLPFERRMVVESAAGEVLYGKVS